MSVPLLYPINCTLCLEQQYYLSDFVFLKGMKGVWYTTNYIYSCMKKHIHSRSSGRFSGYNDAMFLSEVLQGSREWLGLSKH